MSEHDKQMNRRLRRKIYELEQEMKKPKQAPKVSSKPLKRINLNTLAKDISSLEAGKEQVNIAQIHELMKVMFILLGKYQIEQVSEVLERYKNGK